MKMEINWAKNFHLKFCMKCNIIHKKALINKIFKNKFKKNNKNNSNNLIYKAMH